MFIGVEEVEINWVNTINQNADSFCIIEFKDPIINETIIKKRNTKKIYKDEFYIFKCIKEIVKNNYPEIKSIYSDFWM